MTGTTGADGTGHTGAVGEAQAAGSTGHADAADRADPVGEVLSALADPMRRRILDRAAALGEASPTVLAAELPVSRQAVVKHLAVLQRAGLVEGRREGREALYAVRSERLGATARWMDGVAAEWDARLPAVKRPAEEPGRP